MSEYEKLLIKLYSCDSIELEDKMELLKYPLLIYLYSVMFLKSRWYAVEHLLVSDPVIAVYYMHAFKFSRSTLFESSILKSPEAIYRYCDLIHKKPIPNVDSVMAKSPEYGLYYATLVSKARFKPEDERVYFMNATNRFGFVYTKRFIRYGN